VREIRPEDYAEHKRLTQEKNAIRLSAKRDAWVRTRNHLAAQLQECFNKYFQGIETPVNICECGSTKAGTGGHSTWCPAFAATEYERLKTSDNNVK
jgi:hypothetical protein